MVENQRTITVRGGDNGEFNAKFHSVDSINSIMHRIFTDVKECINKDDQEAQQGKNTAQCPDTGQFDGQVKQLKTDLQTLETDLWGIYDASIKDKDSIITDLVDTVGVKYGKVGVNLDTIQGTVNTHLQMDEWSSDGAKMYKSALPTQKNATQELEELCYRGDTIVTNAAAINGVILDTIYDSLSIIHEPISQKAGQAVKNLEYWSDSGASENSSGCVSYLYYHRSDTARANLQHFKDWLTGFISHGDWETGTFNMAHDLPSLSGSVKNLKAGGVWPEPIAGAAVEANVDEGGTGNAGQQSGSGAATGGGGIDLNNRGVIFG